MKNKSTLFAGLKTFIYFYIPNGRFMSDTKSHILIVSLKLFLQKNFKEVTMKELVEKTGLSKGAFYHYFESKEQLFREIIDFFFAQIMSFDFNKLESDSLYNFYHSHSDRVNSMRYDFLLSSENNKEDFLSLNFFALLFDAFKMFPDFKLKMEAYHKKEKDAWTRIIAKARKEKEICSPLSDTQIAQIFLYSSDGLTMNLTMDSNNSDLDTKLRSLWDNFYKTIKC